MVGGMSGGELIGKVDAGGCGAGGRSAAGTSGS